MKKYVINFTDAGKHVARWGEYLSFGEAMSAIRDADMRIPLHWEYTIDAAEATS